MATSLVLLGLIRRRAELAGEMAKLRRRIGALQIDLRALDHCLIMWGCTSPETIKPIEKRGPRRSINVTAFILDTLRDSETPLPSAELATMLMRHLGIPGRDDVTVRRHVLVVLGGLRSLRKRGLVMDSADGWMISDE
ncbi:hypothetical protein [Niveispirillum sp. KHB5.9]|uniref:hypothetical protein n=1 Tax=Niveispirillum sp. KHB5.9 TaxID=3400269 RepID=UPI003A8BDF52